MFISKYFKQIGVIYMLFELILTSAVIITGLITLLSFVFIRKQALATQSSDLTSKNQSSYPRTILSTIVEYSRSFFPVLFVVLLLRSFVIEPFRIPTGSLIPTLLVGDFILVNRYDYGLRLPVTNTKIFSIGEPKRGEIAVFRFPIDPSEYYIKRVIGLPGDHVRYTNKVLYVNDQMADQQFVTSIPASKSDDDQAVVEKSENFLGTKHMIYQIPDKPAEDFETVVPEGEYFVMGDNRDSSYDSRYWGYVPEQNLKGKAIAIWFSFGNGKIRWDRIGKHIQ
jgi:signal peptidase I